MGYLPQRAYLAAQLEPGQRRVWGPGRNETRALDFESGNTYVLILVESYGANRSLGGTSWQVGDPADIRRLVEVGKLSHVTTTEAGMLKLAQKAGADKTDSVEAAGENPQPAVLPATFTSVWYRTGDRAASVKAYDSSGVLTVSTDTIRFENAKKTFEISTASIESVSLDKMSAKR